MNVYKLAIVGCGGVSQMHFDGYAVHPERVCVVAACDPSPEALQRRQEQYGFPHAFDTVERLAREAEFDVAVVCTPTPVREAVLRVLAEAGRPIYCEKPLSDTLDEARRIVALCEERGVPLAVDQNFRYFYPFDLARRIVADGRVGRPLHVLHRELMFRQDRGWRVSCERHALSIMGVHWFDGFRYLLDDEATSIVCRTASSPAVACAGETEAAVQITFGGGAIVSYAQSFSSAFRGTETVLIGEQGTLHLDYDGAALLEAGRGGEPVERWQNPCARPGGKDESCFLGLQTLIAAVEQGAEAPNSGRDNLKTIAMLDAAYRSADEGRIIALEGGLPV